MPRIKLTRTLLYLLVILFIGFVAFTLLTDVTKRKGDNSLSEPIFDHLHKDDEISDDLNSLSKVREYSNYGANWSKSVRNLTSLTKLWLETKNVLPWFMESGSFRPNSSELFRNLPIWPDQGPLEDRIVNQLMYMPPYYAQRKAEEKLKKIFLFFGRGGWNARDLPMGQKKFLRDKCPVNTCELSMDKKDSATADAIFFKDKFQWPKHSRNPKQIWLLFLLECPNHTQAFKNLKHVINWTATYRHDSDIVAPYERYFSLPSNKNKITEFSLGAKKSKQVAWFVSNCAAKNKRLEYARELSEYIEVDIFGGCGKKRCPRTSPRYCFDLLNNDYKFYLAFENSNCKDYITEKFFVNGLKNDILPIVMGASQKEYEVASPAKSYIHVDDFVSPKELASYLLELDRNHSQYDSYFDWKNRGEFINTYFWCRLCALLHSPRAEFESHSYEDLGQWWAGSGVCNNKR